MRTELLSKKLALDGGTRIRRSIFPPWPCFGPEEIDATVRVLQSGKVNYWTGEEGREFEREFAAQAGCKYGVALANGTLALELALMTLGIGPGDEVIVPSKTFVATASSVVMRGAKPVVADIDRDSQNLTADTVRPLVTARTKAIIAVHLGGWPCDMGPILELAGRHSLSVIEDCAQCHGATYKGRPVGSFGKLAAFSFCQDKIMTTGGEGGMLTTSDEALWERAWSFKDHGKSYDAVYRRQHPVGFRWLHESFGTNWRMTEMQSAMGRVLLRKLPRFVERRRHNARLLTQRLSCIPSLRVPTPSLEFAHSYYRCCAFLRLETLRHGWDRDRVLDAICAEGVPCLTGSCSEIYLEKAFPVDMRPSERLPVARELSETSMAFLVHPTVSDQDIADTGDAVEKVLAVATETEHQC